MTTIEIKVEFVRWPKEGVENPYDFFILATDKGCAKGKIKWRPQANELLKLSGEWGEYRGMKEFKFSHVELNIPIDPKAQLTYVSERTYGMVEKTAEAIWERLGDDWKNISDKDAEKLKIKPSTFEKFKLQIENLAHNKAKSDAISYLISKGATSGMAATAWERWEDDTIGIVNENPYRLAELPNYGFKDVDMKIRHSFGIADGDERRIRAAVIYAISDHAKGGSTVIQWQDLIQILAKLRIDIGLAVERISEMFADYSLWAFPSGKRLSLIRHYNAETSILNFISSKLAV